MRKSWFAWMVLAACLLWASISLASTAAVYEIGTAEEYKAFVAAINGGETNACARLTSNIDFNGAALTDISVVSTYTGTFDGQNYALQNFTLSASTGSALFQTLGEGGVLKNIQLENVTLRTSASVESTALLCHVNQGRIENCHVTGFSTYSRNVSEYAKKVGVIAYENRNQIIGCTVESTSLQARNYAGGIACINETNGLIDGCSTTGEIRAYTTQSAIAECYAGGIAAVNKNSIQNCVNTAKVTAQKSGIAYAGGIAALAIGSADFPARFYRCSNSGAIRTLYANTPSIQDRAAGIVAACEGFFEIGKCSNAGTVEAITVAAGIAGTKSAGNDVFINNCWNSGEVKASASASSYAIGIAGPGGSAKIRNCLNTGSLVAAGKRAPIMIDYASADDEINCYALESCVAGSSGSDGFPAWNGRIITNSRSQTQIKDDVYRELNAGNSTAVWKQGSVHPELCEEEAVPPTLTGITITTPPAKTIYKAGESFDPAGMVVTASYSDGSAKEVTGYTVDNGDNLLLTQTGLIISYSEGGRSASTTLRITVKAPTYTVTVEGGRGGGSYEVGASVTIQANVPDGKVFAGWTDPQKILSDSSAPAATFTMPAKDVKLTANFADVVPVKLTIQKEPDQKAYYAGEDFDTTGMVLVVEYSDGKSQRIDSGFVLKDGNNLKANQTFVTVSYSRNGVEVTAVQPISVSVRKYTVTVVGGTGGGSYAEGETVSISANQAPMGQYFTGWTGMDGLNGASAGFVMPAHDVNLTANYADIILTAITITAPPVKTEYTEGEFFSSDGMVVTAHYNNGSSGIVGNYAISNTNALTTQDQSITILFTENGITQTAEISISVSVRTYPVSVTNGKGGGNYPEGEIVTVTAEKAPKGKYFTGWTGAEELVFTSGSAASASAAFTMPARAVSLEAVYEDIRLTSIVITTPPIQTSYTAGDAFNPSGMKVEARYNDGHSEEIENYLIKDGNALQTDQTSVTISYSRNGIEAETTQDILVSPRTYPITYAPGAHGTGQTVASAKTDGVALTLPDALFTRYGFVQTGWALTDGGEKACDLNGNYTMDAAQTFYPVWTHAKYAIQYVLDGGVIGDTTCPASYTYGTGAVLPEQVVREGFRFLGWYEDGSETSVTAIGADETGERTFTARWMQQHAVTFDANGAQGVMQPVTMDNGALFTLPQNAFVIPEGQRFCGWLVGETIRQPGDSFPLLAPLTVKALWEYLPADVPPAEDEDKMAAEAIPKTGDGFNMALWLSLACLSLAGAAWLIDLRVRKG